MVTWTKHDELDYFGTHSDTMPTVGISVGSVFTYTDTGEKLTFDGTAWNPKNETITQAGLVERIFANIMKRLNVDSSGRLRVSAESVASHAVTLASLATLTNITNWGVVPAQGYSQQQSYMAFHQGYRRNIVHS